VRDFLHMYNSRTRSNGLTAMALLVSEGRVIQAGELYALNENYQEGES